LRFTISKHSLNKHKIEHHRVKEVDIKVVQMLYIVIIIMLEQQNYIIEASGFRDYVLTGYQQKMQFPRKEETQSTLQIGSHLQGIQ
jgi:hypothetical protein